MAETHVCTEPAVEGGKTRVVGAEADTIIYPHVETCMSITVVTQNKLIGGHVSAMTEGATKDDPVDAGKSITLFAGQMKKLIDAPILKVMFIGYQAAKPSNNHYTLLAALQALGASTDRSAASFLRIGTSVLGAVDIFVKGGSHALSFRITSRMTREGR